jgi:hypothetical protein
MSDIVLDGNDVHVRALERTRCDDCNKPATHQLHLDLRNNGVTTVVFTGCGRVHGVWAVHGGAGEASARVAQVTPCPRHDARHE